MAPPVVKVSMSEHESAERNVGKSPMKKDFASVVEQLTHTLTKEDGPAQPLAPPLNMDDDEPLDSALFPLDPKMPAMCRLETLAMHIEAKMTVHVFQRCLAVLRNLNPEDEGYAEKASMEVIDLVGDRNLEHLPLLWQFVSLETQTFGAWAGGIPGRRLGWNAGAT